MTRTFLKPRLSLFGYVLAFGSIAFGLSFLFEDQTPRGPLKTVEGVLEGIDTFSILMLHRTTLTVDNNMGESFSLEINADPGNLPNLEPGAHLRAVIDDRGKIYDLAANAKPLIHWSHSEGLDGRVEMLIASFLAALSFGWAIARDRKIL
jgi:hypothetical protein